MAKILIAYDNNAIAEEIRSIVWFLEYDVEMLSSLANLQSLPDSEDFILALVIMENQAYQAEAVDRIKDSIGDIAIYTLYNDAGGETDNESIPNTSGQIRYPIKYRNLLGTIRQAEMAPRRDRDSGSPGVSRTLIGSSPLIKEVQRLVRQVAMSEANVVILGESGTGKEVVARTIHHLSQRKDKPFVAINCGAIPEDLLESELFGHEKGAYTGATSSRRGRFELAEGGTLFLDEVGDMPLPMQVKLLRVLQERTFERLGGNQSINTNARIIAATHQDLEQRIADGKFREDLYYRLNVFPIELAPLRNRAEDIPQLIREFITRLELERHTPITLDDSAINALALHSWPGNVRELGNIIERLSILYPGEHIGVGDLPSRYQPAGGVAPGLVTSSAAVSDDSCAANLGNTGINLRRHITHAEKALIQQALDNADWVVAKAAKALGVQRTTLVEKIRKLDIDRESPSLGPCDCGNIAEAS